MLTIIEGVDRTGKTSLCKRVGGEHDEYLHFSAPRTDAVEEYVRPLLDYRPWQGADLYIDRHYLGERVWPKVFGRDSIMDKTTEYWIELFLASRGANAILAYRDPVDLEEACFRDDEPSAGGAAHAQELFIQSTVTSSLEWHIYEHGDAFPRDRALELQTGSERIMALSTQWIGHPNPDAMVVVCETSGPEWDGLPYVPSKKSDWPRVARRFGVPSKPAIVNALSYTGTVNPLSDMWIEFGRPPVLAVGEAAERALREHGIDYEV
jgi:hypothetical protein